MVLFASAFLFASIAVVMQSLQLKETAFLARFGQAKVFYLAESGLTYAQVHPEAIQPMLFLQSSAKKWLYAHCSLFNPLPTDLEGKIYLISNNQTIYSIALFGPYRCIHKRNYTLTNQRITYTNWSQL